MESYSLLAFMAIIFFTGSAYAQSEECTKGLQVCLNSYLGDVFGHLEQQNQDLICTDLNVFVKCVMDLNCGLSEQDRDQAINQIKEELVKKGFECDIDLNSVTSRPGPYTTVHPDLTTKPKTCPAAMQWCTQSYIDSVFEEAANVGSSSNNKWICPLINKFVDCMIYSPCELEEVKDVVNREVNKQLSQNGIECEIRYGNQGNRLQKAAMTTVLFSIFLACFNMFF